ncbi:hypothetical protein [Bradyrhizobium sp. USDA 4452]
MLVPMEGPNTSLKPDDIATFEEAETAQSLIDAGFAELAEDAPPSRREVTVSKPEPVELPGAFGKLSRAELDELARKLGLDLKPFKSKADVIAALEKAAEEEAAAKAAQETAAIEAAKQSGAAPKEAATASAGGVEKREG